GDERLDRQFARRRAERQLVATDQSAADTEVLIDESRQTVRLRHGYEFAAGLLRCCDCGQHGGDAVRTRFSGQCRGQGRTAAPPYCRLPQTHFCQLGVAGANPLPSATLRSPLIGCGADARIPMTVKRFALPLLGLLALTGCGREILRQDPNDRPTLAS